MDNRRKYLATPSRILPGDEDEDFSEILQDDLIDNFFDEFDVDNAQHDDDIDALNWSLPTLPLQHPTQKSPQNQTQRFFPTNMQQSTKQQDRANFDGRGIPASKAVLGGGRRGRGRPLHSVASSLSTRQNSAGYRDKRERNNMAVRKSREKAKFREQRLLDTFDRLRSDNRKLRDKFSCKLKELQLIRSLMLQSGLKPSNEMQLILESNPEQLLDSF